MTFYNNHQKPPKAPLESCFLRKLKNYTKKQKILKLVILVFLDSYEIRSLEIFKKYFY